MCIEACWFRDLPLIPELYIHQDSTGIVSPSLFPRQWAIACLLLTNCWHSVHGPKPADRIFHPVSLYHILYRRNRIFFRTASLSHSKLTNKPSGTLRTMSAAKGPDTQPPLSSFGATAAKRLLLNSETPLSFFFHCKSLVLFLQDSKQS